MACVLIFIFTTTSYELCFAEIFLLTYLLFTWNSKDHGKDGTVYCGMLQYICIEIYVQKKIQYLFFLLGDILVQYRLFDLIRRYNLYIKYYSYIGNQHRYPEFDHAHIKILLKHFSL